MKKKIVLTSTIVTIAVGATLFWIYSSFFSAPQPQLTKQEVFIVPLKTQVADSVAKLVQAKFVRSAWAFNLVAKVKGKAGKIEPGGYYLKKSMNVWQVVDKVYAAPDMKWVILREGLRKEEIGEILAKTFNWGSEALEKWDNVYTAMKFDELEGVYFPDTYLIPTKENGFDIAKRMINRFNEKFAPYVDKFAAANIKWTTALKIASLIQREAGGVADMPIIAGVIWNRLDKDMKLDIDATAQYAKGKVDGKWWSIVTPKDLEIDSPFNTYLYKGLPPQPICNPGIAAIDAVLNPAKTDCLYYLHDIKRQIHCAKTYEEHKENIKKYL